MNTMRTRKNITVAVIAGLTLLFSLSVSLISVDAVSVGSATGKISVSSGAALRKSASNSGKKIISLKQNTTVTISQEVFTTKKKTGSKTRWYYVKANGKSGYIRSDQIKSISYSTVSGKATSTVKYRSGAGSSMPKKGTLKKNGTVTVVLAAKAKGSGAKWYKIKSGKSYYYVPAKNIKLTGSSAPVKATFKITGLRYPQSLKAGAAFTVKGKITCNKTISKGVVRVNDSSGKQVIRTEVKVNGKTFDILKADKNIKFGSLAAGTYTYLVDVYVDGIAYTQVNKTFTIKAADTPAAPTPQPDPAGPADPPADTGTGQAAAAAVSTSGPATFTVSELRYPESLYEGGAFTIKGKITCNKVISKGVITVLNSSGGQALSTEVAVNGTVFDILDADKNTKFGSLPVGSYTYLVDVYVDGKAYNQVRKTFVVKETANAARITNKAFELAWPAGTASSKYNYDGGSPTAAYRLALEAAYPNRSSWGAAPKVGASCDVFVGTVIRACGVDSSVPRGLADQFPYFKGSSKYTKINYTGERSQLRSGDIIMFTRDAGNTHICLYLKKNGKEYIAEANYQHTYGIIVSSASSITSKLKLGDKKRMEVYRIKEY